MNWEELLPTVIGTLPGGGPLIRTDPSARAPSPIAFLGVYPALTKQRQFVVGGVRMNLPVAVERESFEPASSSGGEVDQHYLQPLGLRRKDVFIFDLVPYYLANITIGDSGRSMADNVELYEAEQEIQTGIVRRPRGEGFLDLVRSMPGNIDRIQSYLAACQPKVVFTLGTEPAAFLRGLSFDEAAGRVDELFYAEPAAIEVLGHRFETVHLAHPRHFRNKTLKWTRRHESWCESVGRDDVADMLDAHAGG